MEFRDMNYIINMAKYQSISLAAKELYIPQPTLSNVLKRVEEELGQRLFIRTKSGLELTAVGARFVELSSQIIEMKEYILDELHTISNQEFSTLTVGAPSMWCANLLAHVIPDFINENPGVKVVVWEKSMHQMEQDLIEGKLDLALLHIPINLDYLEYEELFDEQIMLAISPQNPISRLSWSKKESQAISIKRLAGQSMIFTNAERFIRQNIEFVLRNNNVPYKISVTTDNLNASLIMAAQNAGIAFVSDRQVSFYNAGPSQSPLFLHADSFLPKWTVVAATRREEMRDGVLRFQSALKKHIQHHRDIFLLDYSGNQKSHNK